MSAGPIDLKQVSVDRFVTDTKLSGSVMSLQGFTKPEHWPFVVIAVVAKPGSEQLLELVREFHGKLAALAGVLKEEHWAAWPGKAPGGS